MTMLSVLQRHRVAASLAAFVLGTLVTILALTLPAVQEVFVTIERSGYFGMFLAGVLYATAFTATPATVLAANAPGELSLPFAAILGGIGALAYDAAVFVLVRRVARRRFLATLRDRLHKSAPRRHWLWTVLGFLILASPLPDELGAGLLGALRMPSGTFLLLSWAANTLGFAVILLLR